MGIIAGVTFGIAFSQVHPLVLNRGFYLIQTSGDPAVAELHFKEGQAVWKRPSYRFSRLTRFCSSLISLSVFPADRNVSGLLPVSAHQCQPVRDGLTGDGTHVRARSTSVIPFVSSRFFVCFF